MISQSALGVRLNHLELSNMRNLIGSQIVLFIMVFCAWVAVVNLIQLDSVKKKWYRFLLCFAGVMSISLLFYFLSPFRDYPLDLSGKAMHIVEIIRPIYRGVIVSLLIIPIAHYFFEAEKVQKEKVEIERIKQQGLITQLNFLREQLNPHFLFNSLNVLKSGTSDPWVKSFTIELANVYRYLLKFNGDSHLVDLASEMEFIHSYIHILEERFEKGLIFTMNIDKKHLANHLPPLSLQILIENAVKHNVISLIHPLHIEIFTENSYLVVSNNIRQKKISNIPNYESTGIGLENLKTRYHLIANEKLIIEKTDLFTVKIPLLA